MYPVWGLALGSYKLPINLIGQPQPPIGPTTPRLPGRGEPGVGRGSSTNDNGLESVVVTARSLTQSFEVTRTVP